MADPNHGNLITSLKQMFRIWKEILWAFLCHLWQMISGGVHDTTIPREVDDTVEKVRGTNPRPTPQSDWNRQFALQSCSNGLAGSTQPTEGEVPQQVEILPSANLEVLCSYLQDVGQILFVGSPLPVWLLLDEYSSRRSSTISRPTHTRDIVLDTIDRQLAMGRTCCYYLQLPGSAQPQNGAALFLRTGGSMSGFGRLLFKLVVVGINNLVTVEGEVLQQDGSSRQSIFVESVQILYGSSRLPQLLLMDEYYSTSSRCSRSELPVPKLVYRTEVINDCAELQTALPLGGIFNVPKEKGEEVFQKSKQALADHWQLACSDSDSPLCDDDSTEFPTNDSGKKPKTSPKPSSDTEFPSPDDYNMEFMKTESELRESADVSHDVSSRTNDIPEISIRPDILALGFTHFSDVFDLRKILLIYRSDPVSESLEVYFFHPEGMATLLGVAVPYCEVRVRADNLVEVKELKKRCWTELWTESNMHLYRFCILDSRDFMDERSLDLCPVTFCQLSATQVAEEFGVGVEGIEFFQTSKVQTQQCVSRQHSWFYEFLRGHKSNAAEIFSKDCGSQQSLSNTETSNGKVEENVEGAGGSTDTNFSCSNTAAVLGVGGSKSTYCSSFHEGEYSTLRTARDTDVDAQDQNTNRTGHQPSQLTVKVSLDPETYTFYSPSDVLTLYKQQQKGRFVKFSHPQLVASSDQGEADNVMRECLMVPEVTIQFLYHPERDGPGRKRFKTTLSVHFYMDADSNTGSNFENEKQFGWYHDKLRVCFRCEERNVVKQEKKLSLSEEYVGTLRTCTTDRTQGNEKSLSAILGGSRCVKGFCGHRTFLSFEFSGTSKKETTQEETHRRQESESIPVRCLEDHAFSISNVAANNEETAYQATIFPPLTYFDLWSPSAPDLAVSRGIMSTVSMAFKGEWTIKEEGTTESPSVSSMQLPRFCNYEFSCKRDLTRHRVTTEKVSGETLAGKGKTKTSDTVKTMQIVETMIVQQKLQKCFIINHSFSHMQMKARYRPEEYVWDLPNRRHSPIEEFLHD